LLPPLLGLRLVGFGLAVLKGTLAGWSVYDAARGDVLLIVVFQFLAGVG
jgi:hypothetical protein